jgi:hypothetical protein
MANIRTMDHPALVTAIWRFSTGLVKDGIMLLLLLHTRTGEADRP